ncbi:MAG TPA: ABC transporter substrate-binding protein [Stellaceae bacterium]|jgi:branched-chain amino acid transport system substrate-binding protein|nr:ABC transporter substrate-binding protein [Stellaceae bacterium]
MIRTFHTALAAFLLVAAPALAQQQPPISDGVVKIGAILDMSGPYSQNTGDGSVAAAKMAVEDFGGKVLGAPIQFVYADHQSNTGRALDIARDWFEKDHVDAILDVAGSSEALIVQAAGRTRHKIVSLSAPAAIRLTNEGCSPTGIHYSSDTYSIAHTIVPALVKAGGNSWFFITVDYSFGYDLETDTAQVVKSSGGTVLGHALHPLDATDFISYLAQAKQSGANVIALANAGGDTLNTIRAAAAQHMIPGKQTIVGLTLRANAVDTLGLQTAQGMMMAEPFYWDMNDQTRTWSKRFFARVGRMPNAVQASLYSSVLHYLKAVQKAGTDATDPVMAAMREMPVDDMFAHDGHIRADGVMVHDMYLFQVKSPAESHYPWDYLKLVAKIPGDEAFQPLSESKCPYVNK